MATYYVDLVEVVPILTRYKVEADSIQEAHEKARRHTYLDSQELSQDWDAAVIKEVDTITCPDGTHIPGEQFNS